MSASEGQHAFGFELQVSDDGVTYDDVLEIVNCNTPERLRAAAKATHNSSPDGHTEAKPGIKSTGPLQFTINVTEEQYDTLDEYYEGGDDLYWKVKLPLDEGETTPQTFVMRGFVSKLGQIKLDPEDTQVMICDVEITRTSGKVTYAGGS